MAGRLRESGRGATQRRSYQHHGGRRLGDEYRTVCKPTLDHVEDWEERANAIPCFLEEAIAAKIRKYGGLCNSCWLVVDLNMNDSGIRHHETEKAILEIKARHVAHFEAISVIWKRQLY